MIEFVTLTRIDSARLFEGFNLIKLFKLGPMAMTFHSFDIHWSHQNCIHIFNLWPSTKQSSFFKLRSWSKFISTGFHFGTHVHRMSYGVHRYSLSIWNWQTMNNEWNNQSVYVVVAYEFCTCKHVCVSVWMWAHRPTNSNWNHSNRFVCIRHLFA